MAVFKCGRKSIFCFETIDLIADPHQCLEPELFANLNKTYKLQTSPGFNHYLYHFNTQKYPFHNKKIRKAFAYAIDKEDLLYTTLRKEQRLANQFIPPAIYKNTQYQNLFEGFNPDKSRQFFKEGLKEIGLKATSFPPITLCFNRSTFHKKISIKIKAQWEKTLPVTIILKEMEWKDYLLDISSGDFQIAKMEYAVFYPDPVDFLEEFIFERNFSHWKSTEFNKLIHTSFYESNLAKRELVLRQAEKLLIDEMIISPVYFSVDTYLVHPKITCFPITKRNLIDFKYLSL